MPSVPRTSRPGYQLSQGGPMLAVSFAFVVATLLFFWFPQTRWMGVVCLFVLLSIHPVLFGGLLVAGLVLYAYFRPRYYPLPRSLSNENTKKRVLLPLIALPWLGGSL